MQHHSRWTIGVVVVSMLLVGCSTRAETKPIAGPIVEPLDSGRSRITLTESHVRRLGIQFEEMRNTDGRLEAPYAVVVYDNIGGEWVYVSSQPTVFDRTAVKVERVEGGKVYFSKGPEPGAKLVTSGAAELYGIECGVGEKVVRPSSLCPGAR